MHISASMLAYALTSPLFYWIYQDPSELDPQNSEENSIRIISSPEDCNDTIHAQNDAQNPCSTIRRICIWKDGEILREDVLYLLTPDQQENFLTKAEKSFPALQNAASKRGIRVRQMQAFLCQRDEILPDEKILSRYKNCHVALTRLQTVRSCSRLAEILMQIRSFLLEWNLNLVEGILKNRDEGELFIAVNEVLDRDFAIVNMDMQYVFTTDGYAASRALTENRKLPPSLFQDLVSKKRFHRAAREKSAFYYYTDAVERMNLCQNIFAGDQYIARIVLTLRPGEMELPQGAVELFSIYADHIQDLFAHNAVFREKHAMVQMQELCRMLLENQTVEASSLQSALENLQWKQGDEFLAVLLKFNTESGWDAQLYMMLPYLCSVLEAEWSGSFALQLESEILLIVNCSYQEETARSCSTREQRRERILQKLAYFVRENTCKAGVSPFFNDFTHLRSAMDTAEAAYQIGMTQMPHRWYYLFDEVRLEYLIRSMKGSLPGVLLVHPALRILREYDAVHKSELNQTLSVYLKNNLNMTAAAEELYIHRTSFCRRINQIRKLTGLKLEDPDTVLTLLLSYRMSGN